MNKNILIIGAGAVGLVYGKHFADAGYLITFFVREKYLDALAKGTILYNLRNDKLLKKPLQFDQFSLMTTFEEVAQKHWDQIYLCFSSTALQSFDFTELKKHLIDQPIIVMLQPSVEDIQVLQKTFTQKQIVEGMITLISYAAPLVTEKVEKPGIAYWFPPLAPTPFSGEAEPRQKVIETFKISKISANSVKSVQNKALFPTAYLMTFLIALEHSNWSFDSLRKNQDLLKQIKIVCNEIYIALETKHNIKRPMGIDLLSLSGMLKLLLILAPKVMPMDIETYLQAHFTKVNDQTKLYMNNYLATAKSQGLKYTALESFIKLN